MRSGFEPLKGRKLAPHPHELEEHLEDDAGVRDAAPSARRGRWVTPTSTTLYLLRPSLTMSSVLIRSPTASIWSPSSTRRSNSLNAQSISRTGT